MDGTGTVSQSKRTGSQLDHVFRDRQRRNIVPVERVAADAQQRAGKRDT